MNTFNSSPIIKLLSSKHPTLYSSIIPQNNSIIFNPSNLNLIGLSWFFDPDIDSENIYLSTNEYETYYSNELQYFKYQQLKRIYQLTPDEIDNNKLFFLFFSTNPLLKKSGFSNTSITLQTNKNVHVLYFLENNL